MLLKITEYCAWENESWSYIIDLDKQDGEALDHLMIFIRLANEQYIVAAADAKGQPYAIARHPLFNPHPRNPFAASRYNISFYNAIDTTLGRVRLLTHKTTERLREGSGYHDYANILTDMIISPRRMKSALTHIRDKKENILYKTFDSLFLKKKQTA